MNHARSSISPGANCHNVQIRLVVPLNTKMARTQEKTSSGLLLDFRSSVCCPQFFIIAIIPTSSLDSAFTPYYLRMMRRGKKKSFFFVTYTGYPVSTTNAARKGIRAQAARASASQRIETTAMRRRNQQCQSTSPSKEPRLSTPGTRTKTAQNQSNHGNLIPPTIKSMLISQATSVVHQPQWKPMTPYLIGAQPMDIADLNLDVYDWEFGIENLIRERKSSNIKRLYRWHRLNFLDHEKAVLEIRRQENPCDPRILNILCANEYLHRHPVVLQVLELLSVSSVSPQAFDPGCHVKS